MVMKEQPEGISRKRRDEPKVDPETGKANPAQEYTIFYQRAKGQPRVEIGHTQRANGKWIPILAGSTDWPDPVKNHNDAVGWMRDEYLKQHPDADPAPETAAPAAEAGMAEPEASDLAGGETDAGSMVATGDTEPETPAEEVAEVVVTGEAAPALDDPTQAGEAESVRVIPDVPEAQAWPQALPPNPAVPPAEEWLTAPPPPQTAEPGDVFTDGPFGS